jgi:hypothetical protein
MMWFLGAFKPNVPDGTQVFVVEEPGIRYFWRNGRLVPDMGMPTFGEIDEIVERLNDH